MRAITAKLSKFVVKILSKNKLTLLLTVIYPWMWIFMKNSTMGAQTPCHLATDPLLKDTTGQYFNDCEINDITEFAKDDKLGEKLVQASKDALKLS